MLSTEVTDETKSSNVGKDFQSIIKTELTCHFLNSLEHLYMKRVLTKEKRCTNNDSLADTVRDWSYISSASNLLSKR